MPQQTKFNVGDLVRYNEWDGYIVFTCTSYIVVCIRQWEDKEALHGVGQVNILVVETILLPPEKRNDVNVNRALKLLRVALGNVNNRLQDREYLTGTFSGADIMTGHACFGAMKAGAEIDDYEHLNAYINRLLKRPALEKARSL